MLGPCWHYVCTLLSLLGFVTALHALGGARIYKIQVQIPACWNHAGAFLDSEHALAFTWAFRFSPAACRYVRSTSAASRRDAERAGFKVQGPNLASKAFLNQKALP